MNKYFFIVLISVLPKFILAQLSAKEVLFRCQQQILICQKLHLTHLSIAQRLNTRQQVQALKNDILFFEDELDELEVLLPTLAMQEESMKLVGAWSRFKKKLQESRPKRQILEVLIAYNELLPLMENLLIKAEDYAMNQGLSEEEVGLINIMGEQVLLAYVIPTCYMLKCLSYSPTIGKRSLTKSIIQYEKNLKILLTYPNEIIKSENELRNTLIEWAALESICTSRKINKKKKNKAELISIVKHTQALESLGKELLIKQLYY